MPDFPSLAGDRPESRSGEPKDNYIQPNLGHGLRIWWALFWRTTLASSISYGGSVAAFHLVLPAYSSYSVDYLITLAMMYFILRKRYRRFQIRLVSRNDRSIPLPLTFRRTFRIWWTFTWRTLVYRIILSFAMGVPVGFLSGAVAVIYPPLGPAFQVFVGLAVEAGVGLFVIYSNILDEEMSDFCVTLVPNNPDIVLPDASAPLPEAGI
jgi:hypothetical protein